MPFLLTALRQDSESFSRLLNPDRSIQISGAPAVYAQSFFQLSVKNNQTISLVCVFVRFRAVLNSPRSIYQYSNLVPRLSGQNCKFLKFLLSINFEKRLGYKENNTKYGRLSRKPRSHVRILIYRTWTIAGRKTKTKPFTYQLDY